MYHIQNKGIFRKLSRLFMGVGISLACAQPVFAQTVVGSSNVIQLCGAQGHPYHLMVVESVRKAYKKIGYNIELNWYPNKRALVSADAGLCDGELMRITGIEATYKNLIPIPITITMLEGVAFMNKRLFPNPPKIETWEDLKPLGTYIILGEYYAERGTEGMDVGSVASYTQLFTMLTRGKIDVGIGIRIVGLMEIAHNFPHDKIEMIGKPLVSIPMYHFVHRENAHIIPKLQAALEEMAVSGEIEALNRKSLDKLLTKPNN